MLIPPMGEKCRTTAWRPAICQAARGRPVPRQIATDLHTRHRQGAIMKRKKPNKAGTAASPMTAAEAVVATLAAHGLDTVYALPGVQNDLLFEALFKFSD